MINVHERWYPGHGAGELGDLIDAVGGPHDRLWPRTGSFPPMRLNGPQVDLPAGGHGPMTYRTVAYEPGRRIVWRFDERVGLAGIHAIDLLDGVGMVGLRHTIAARAVGRMRLVWPVGLRWLHDACVEELLDQADATLNGRHAQHRHHPAWTRALLWLGGRRRRASRAGHTPPHGPEVRR